MWNADTISLPFPQFGGANAGAGWSTKANFQSLMYDPYKPVGQRYSKMDFAPIARVYHSANCLDPSGKVLVAGCENCGAYQQLVRNCPRVCAFLMFVLNARRGWQGMRSGMSNAAVDKCAASGCGWLCFGIAIARHLVWLCACGNRPRLCPGDEVVRSQTVEGLSPFSRDRGSHARKCTCRGLCLASLARPL